MRAGAALLMLCVGCSSPMEVGQVMSSGGDDAGGVDLAMARDATTAPDMAHAPSMVSITAPAMGDKFQRTKLGAGGVEVAEVAFAAGASADVTTIEYLAEGTTLLGSAQPPDFALTHDFEDDGPRWVRAVAKNAAGLEVARARVDFTIEAGPQMSCQEKLTSLGIGFTVGPATKGVSDPVTVMLPLSGIKYFAYGATTAQSKLLMDCTLALALHRLAEAVKPLGVVALEHIGIYNYRCIGGGNPDTDGCEPSQHAFAKAIDIHELRSTAGQTYNVETDWVIDPDTEPTCGAATSNDKDKFLHDAACGWHDDLIFNIILTPNYNAAHRNHFHVDLTDGSDYIGLRAMGIDPPLGIGDD